MAESNLRAGIKYCGHCNPQINGPEIIQDLLKEIPDLSTSNWSEPGCNVFLIISACPVGCASIPITNKAWLNIVTNQVRSWFIPLGHPGELLLTSFKKLGYVFVSTN